MCVLGVWERDEEERKVNTTLIIQSTRFADGLGALEQCLGFSVNLLMPCKIRLIWEILM